MGFKGRARSKNAGAAPSPGKGKGPKANSATKVPKAAKVARTGKDKAGGELSGRTLRALADPRFAPGKIYKQKVRNRKGKTFECVLRCEKDGFYNHKGQRFDTPTALVTTFAREEVGQAAGTRRIPSHFFKIGAPARNTRPEAKTPKAKVVKAKVVKAKAPKAKVVKAKAPKAKVVKAKVVKAKAPKAKVVRAKAGPTKRAKAPRARPTKAPEPKPEPLARAAATVAEPQADPNPVAGIPDL